MCEPRAEIQRTRSACVTDRNTCEGGGGGDLPLTLGAREVTEGRFLDRRGAHSRLKDPGNGRREMFNYYLGHCGICFNSGGLLITWILSPPLCHCREVKSVIQHLPSCTGDIFSPSCTVVKAPNQSYPKLGLGLNMLNMGQSKKREAVTKEKLNYGNYTYTQRRSRASLFTFYHF